MNNKDALPDKIFLCDFGATHVRLALSGKNGPEQVAVYKVAEWPALDDVLADYAQKTGKSLEGASLYLSHTGHVEDGALKLDYKKTNPWSFNLDDIRKKFAFAKLVPINDLKATAYAPLFKGADLFHCFREGAANDELDAAVIGIGTGAGHAFLSAMHCEVRETYGGHFPLVATTNAQAKALDYLRAHKSTDRTLIFEDALSGEGLFHLYQSLAGDTQIKNVSDMLPAKETDPCVRQATTLFCEFLGLYAHILCSVNFAYGGVYLCGGVIDRLNKADLFNEQAFVNQFHQHMVQVVRNSLQHTPLYRAAHEHTALYGLQVYAGEQG